VVADEAMQARAHAIVTLRRECEPIVLRSLFFLLEGMKDQQFAVDVEQTCLLNVFLIRAFRDVATAAAVEVHSN